MAFIWCTSAQALMNGDEFPSNQVSTVRINIQHEHFLRSINQWEYYDSKCSAVVVGTKPLTLITAAHCLKEVKLFGSQQLPDISILNPDEIGVKSVKIKQAFYRPYHEVAENISLDIAVLVFDAQLEQPLKPVTISLKMPNQQNQLMVCGFGKGHLEKETVNPRCAKRNYLNKLIDFNQALPLSYKSKDEMLYIKSETQFSYTKEISIDENSLIAINRLNLQDQYDNQLGMVTEGDSGGPWLFEDVNKNYILIAISSLVERFYNKNIYWEFFDKDTPLSDFPYIAYGLRLDHEMVNAFLMYCKNSGADIKFH